MIQTYTGMYAFLRNSYDAAVTYNGLTYRNATACFEAQKVFDTDRRLLFCPMDATGAKKLSAALPLRPDWDAASEGLMEDILRAKFDQHPALARQLVSTGNEALAEEDDVPAAELMAVRASLRKPFNAEQVKNDLIAWIADYFKESAAPGTPVVVGISGGKDSSVTAALCVEALGRDRVFGVLMPQGEQSDIDCSLLLVKHLGIDHAIINIGETASTFFAHVREHMEINDVARINSPARIRMATLYAVAACKGGRVANTCNLSEDWIGYSTKYGDSAGDFSPLACLTVTEVRQIGDLLGLPYQLVHKIPTDGLCGQTDEEKLGFTYDHLDQYIRGETDLSDDPALRARIDRMHALNLHKLQLMPRFEF